MHPDYAFLQWAPPSAPFADFVALSEWQDMRCAMCGRVADSFQMDHDHTTGLVRGFLCRQCNVDEYVTWAMRPNPFLDWQTGVTPAGMYGLVYLYRSTVRGPIFTAPTQEYADALYAWSDIDASGYGRYSETGDVERYRALGYVLAGVRAIHEERRIEHARPTEWSA